MIQGSRPAASAAVAGLLLAGIGICWSCVDLDSLGNGPPDGGGSGADGSQSITPVIPDPCTHTGTIGLPATDDGANTLPAFHLAVEGVVLDPEKASGYDLDGVCTCDTRPGSIGDGGSSCARPPGACDLDGGIDNAAGLLAKSAATIPLEKLPNRLITTGHRSLLIKLEKYNGKANDTEVIVGMIVAEGIRSKGCEASVLDPATGFYSPGLCGNDEWLVAPSAVVAAGGVKVPTVTAKGYVNGFQLVVRFTNPVSLPFTEARSLTFRQAVLTAKLVPLGEDLAPRDLSREPTAAEQRLFRIEGGVLAGRVEAADLVHAVGSYESSLGTLCKNSAFGSIRASICDAVDIRGEVRATPDPALRCDALSAAFGFTAVPALSGDLTDAGEPVDTCADVAATEYECP